MLSKICKSVPGLSFLISQERGPYQNTTCTFFPRSSKPKTEIFQGWTTVKRGSSAKIGEKTYIQIRVNNTTGSRVNFKLYDYINTGDVIKRYFGLDLQILIMNSTCCFLLVEDRHRKYECQWRGYYKIRQPESPNFITWSIFKTESFLSVGYGGMEAWRFDIPDNSSCKAWKEHLGILEFLEKDNASLEYRTLTLGN